VAGVEIELAARERTGDTPCAYCRGPIEGHEADHGCPECGVRLHAECRDELGRCPTPGCAESRRVGGRPTRTPAAVGGGGPVFGVRDDGDAARGLGERLAGALRTPRRLVGPVVVAVALGSGALWLKGRVVPSQADLIGQMAAADDPAERRAVGDRAILNLRADELRALRRRLKQDRYPVEERVAIFRLLAWSLPGHDRSGFPLGVLRDPDAAPAVRRAALDETRRFDDERTTRALVAFAARLAPEHPLAGPVRDAVFARSGWEAAAERLARDRDRSPLARARTAALIAWRRPALAERALSPLALADPSDEPAAARVELAEVLTGRLPPNERSADVLRALLASDDPEVRRAAAAGVLASAAGAVRAEWVQRLGGLADARAGRDYPAWLDLRASWPGDLVMRARERAEVEERFGH